MSLEKLAQLGWYKAEPSSPKEIADLFSIVDRSQADSRVEGISDDPTLRVLEAAEFTKEAKAKSARWYSGHVKDATFEKIFWMRHSDCEIRKWLNENGRTLGRLIFEPNGSLRFPSASRGGGAH